MGHVMIHFYVNLAAAAVGNPIFLVELESDPIPMITWVCGISAVGGLRKLYIDVLCDLAGEKWW